MQPLFPYEIGVLYNGGEINGQLVWTQPNGPGTPVSPAPPTQYPGHDEGYPQIPFAYYGLLNFGCGHWFNCPEVFTVDDPYTENRAALVCCPVCSYIGLIVEPASKWWDEFFFIYGLGNGTGVFN